MSTNLTLSKFTEKVDPLLESAGVHLSAMDSYMDAATAFGMDEFFTKIADLTKYIPDKEIQQEIINIANSLRAPFKLSIDEYTDLATLLKEVLTSFENGGLSPDELLSIRNRVKLFYMLGAIVQILFSSAPMVVSALKS